MLASRRLWLGLAVTGGFLALLFLKFDFTDMRHALGEANYLYVVPAVAIYFVSLYFRAFRWSYLLRPFVSTKTARLYPVVLVGYMANNLLPVRLGEFVRSYYLSTRESARGSTALATIVVERVVDGLTLLFLLAATALFLPVSGLADRVSEEVSLPVWLVGALVVVPFVGVLSIMLLISLLPDLFLRVTDRLVSLLPEGSQGRASGVAKRFIAGFEGLHWPKRLLTVFVLSLPIWLAEGVMYYIIALGFDLQSELDSIGVMIAAMLVLTSVSNLATALPSSQGSVGPFEFFAALALVSMGVGSGVASAYAVVLHLALLLPVIVAGLAHLATQSVSLRQLTRGTCPPTGSEEQN